MPHSETESCQGVVMKMVSIPICVLMLMATHAVSLGAEGDMAAEEVIQRFNNTTDRLPNVFAIKANTQYVMKSRDGNTTKQSVDINYYRDASKCVDIEEHVYNYPGVGGADSKSAPTLYYQRSMVDSMNRAIVYDHGDTQNNRGQEVAFWSDGRKQFDRVSRSINIGQSLEGYAAHDRVPLSQLLKESSALERKGVESIDGSDCYVVEATIPGHGVYTLWLDPQKNHMARKITVTKKANDDFGGNRISDMKLYEGTPSEITYTMDSVAFADVNGVLLPTACKTSLVWKYADGGTAEWQGEHKRVSVDLRPDFKALHAFEPNIPDGTRVSHQDFVGTGIQYEWRKGEVAHRMDNTYLKMLDTAADELKAADTAPRDQETVIPRQTEKGSTSDTVRRGSESGPSADTVAIGGGGIPFGKALCVLLVVLAIVIGGLVVRRHSQGAKR
jgi:hypothetical protein